MGLCPVVLAPDVEHEDTGNEEKGHNQNWNWANLPIRIRILTMACYIFWTKSLNSSLLNIRCLYLDARTVISVESPHSTTASATSSYSWGLGRALSKIGLGKGS